MPFPIPSPRALPWGFTLLCIRNDDGSETLGVKLDDRVLDVRAASCLLDRPTPLTLEQVLRDGSGDALRSLVDAAQSSSVAAPAFRSEGDITYGRLFVNPGKIVCVGLNYRRHAEEIGMAIPKQPLLFSKFGNALTQHRATVRLPPPEVARKFDYETELVIVIGRSARDVSEVEAPDHIAGYCVGNDLSARDLQLETGGQWLAGKTLDGFAPIGPYFVSADLVGDPHALTLETFVNGEQRQSDRTDNFIFNCYQLVSYISRLWTLEPGDIIFTGTPKGVIVGYPAPRQTWLKAGDVVESRIAGLGTLSVTLG